MSGVGVNFQVLPFQLSARVEVPPSVPTAQTSFVPTTAIPDAICAPREGVGVGVWSQALPFQYSNSKARVSPSLFRYQPAAQRSSGFVPAIASRTFSSRPRRRSHSATKRSTRTFRPSAR